MVGCAYIPAGRLFEYHIPPLNFRECLVLSGFASDIPKIDIYHIKDSLADIKELTLKNGSGKKRVKNGILLTQGLADIRTYNGREIVFLPVWCL